MGMLPECCVVLGWKIEEPNNTELQEILEQLNDEEFVVFSPRTEIDTIFVGKILTFWDDHGTSEYTNITTKRSLNWPLTTPPKPEYKYGLWFIGHYI